MGSSIARALSSQSSTSRSGMLKFMGIKFSENVQVFESSVTEKIRLYIKIILRKFRKQYKEYDEHNGFELLIKYSHLFHWVIRCAI